MCSTTRLIYPSLRSHGIDKNSRAVKRMQSHSKVAALHGQQTPDSRASHERAYDHKCVFEMSPQLEQQMTEDGDDWKMNDMV